MINGFFDDSGKQADSNFVCAAGFLAASDDWSSFELQWKNLLNDWQVPEIHMKHLMSSNGAFTGWDYQKKKNAIYELIALFEANNLIGFGIAVDAKFWNRLPRPFQKKHGNAQEFCFERLLRRVKDFIQARNDRNLISLTFDHDQEFAKPRLTRFQNIINRDNWAKETFASIAFASAWAYPQLQAADMLAWETNRLLEVRHNGRSASFGDQTMFRGPDGIQFAAGEYWDEDEFRKQVDGVLSDHHETKARSAPLT